MKKNSKFYKMRKEMKEKFKNIKFINDNSLTTIKYKNEYIKNLYKEIQKYSNNSVSSKI